jgi:HK97 family phage prohead protease
MNKMAKTFILSDGSKQNSHGFSVDLGGLDTERFENNPVMLYSHNREQVIGRWLNLRVVHNRLIAEAEFDTDDELAKQVSKKVDKGFLKGASMGIIIREMRETADGMVATHAELLEASIVSVPSDAGAVALYDEAGEGMITLSDFKISRFQNLDTKKMSEQKQIELEAQVGDLLTQLAVAEQRSQELQTRLAAFEKARITSLIDRAVSDKKIGADERETYMALAEKDFESVEKIIAKMQPVGRIAENLKAGVVKTGQTWDELEKAGKLFALKNENPEEYARLYAEKFDC